jgi:hypothetical protein
MKLLTLSTTLAVAIVMALVAPASAGDQRPMRGHFTGSAIPTDPRCGTDVTIGFAVSGNATHLGRLTGIGSNCTEPTFVFEAVDIWDGIIVLAAADGSTLTFTSSGTQTAPAAGVASFLQELEVIDGTGRFDGASGEMTISGLIDLTPFPLPPVVTGTVSGWVSY